jgi:hypothetical protein
VFNREKPYTGAATPWVYNLRHDPDQLWQCPGYEADSGKLLVLIVIVSEEEYQYGRVAIKNVFELRDRIEYWGITDEQELKETKLDCFRSMAISSLFNWMNGQAHCMVIFLEFAFYTYI